jgi:predicted regulator of amino acid metabolism with ACT domain
MWRYIAKYFNKYPKQRKLAQILFRYGLRIYNNKIFCGEIELTDSKIARAFEIDRRIISSTIETIMKNEELRTVFSNLLPTCHLKNVASKMNWGVIEIIPKDASAPGIIADVASIIAGSNLSIRQTIVDDFEFSEEPRLFIVTEKQIPGSLLPKIKATKGVKAVVVY